MRHIPIAEFKDRLSEVVAAAEAGEDIMITRHGRDVARLIGAEHDRVARRRAAMAGLFKLRENLRAEGVGATRDEVRAWIDEGRR